MGFVWIGLPHASTSRPIAGGNPQNVVNKTCTTYEDVILTLRGVGRRLI